jgi:hypothetical protein
VSVAFDVAFNAAVAFGVSALLVLVVARVSRRLEGRWLAVLFALPFAKALIEIARGVPEHAFFWAFERGIRQDLGSFQLDRVGRPEISFDRETVVGGGGSFGFGIGNSKKRGPHVNVTVRHRGGR